MPPPNGRQSVIISADMGSPALYDPSIFPLQRIKGKGLHGVTLVLEATLDEIFKIRSLTNNRDEFKQRVADAKVEYDKLKSRKVILENRKKSLNPIKMISNYRSIRLLAEAGIALWDQTRTVSESMRRALLSINEEDMQPVDYNDLPPGARISGIAISGADAESELGSDASFFTEAASFVASQVDLLSDNPFTDNFEAEDLQPNAVHEPGSATSDATEGDVRSSTSSRLPGVSSSGNNIFIFRNSLVASRSAIRTATLNHGG